MKHPTTITLSSTVKIGRLPKISCPAICKSLKGNRVISIIIYNLLLLQFFIEVFNAASYHCMIQNNIAEYSRFYFLVSFMLTLIPYNLYHYLAHPIAIYIKSKHIKQNYLAWHIIYILIYINYLIFQRNFIYANEKAVI